MKNWRKHQKYHGMWYFFVGMVSYNFVREGCDKDYSTRKEAAFPIFLVNT